MIYLASYVRRSGPIYLNRATVKLWQLERFFLIALEFCHDTVDTRRCIYIALPMRSLYGRDCTRFSARYRVSTRKRFTFYAHNTMQLYARFMYINAVALTRIQNIAAVENFTPANYINDACAASRNGAPIAHVYNLKIESYINYVPLPRAREAGGSIFARANLREQVCRCILMGRPVQSRLC